MYRVERSTSVPTADCPLAPMIKSPSQCPGSARSSTLAGRSLIITIGSLNRGRTWREYAAGRLRVRPWRMREAISLRSVPLAWMKMDW